MLLIITIVFLAVFAVVVLVMFAWGADAAKRSKQTLANFDAAVGSLRAEPVEAVDIRREETLSAIPWLDVWLHRLDLAPKIRLFLYQAGLSWTVGRLLLVSCASGVVLGSLCYLRTEADTVSIVVGVLGAALPFLYVRFKRDQRFSQFEEKLPDALDLLVGGLRAGHSLNSGIGILAREAASPIDREFRICFDEQNFGVELRDSLDNLARRVPLVDVRMINAAILIQKDSGGNLAEVLERTSHIIRERFRLKRQIRVHTAQGRLTGWILSSLPVVLGFLLYLVNPEHISLLWTRPFGLKMLYSGAVMTCIGALIIRKIVNFRF